MNLSQMARCALAVALLATTPFRAHTAESSPASPSGLGSAPKPIEERIDQLIVKYKATQAGTTPLVSAASLALAQRAADAFGVQVTPKRTMATGAHLFKLDKQLPTNVVERLANAIAAADRNVEYAEPDYIVSPAFTPNDPSFPSQWHYYESAGGINVQSAWDQSTGNGVVVAVVDTGYRPHVDLAGNILPGYDFVSDVLSANDGNGRDSDASDPGNARAAGECPSVPSARANSDWHGTHVAGTVAALTGNGTGVSGVGFGARLLPVRVLGKCDGSVSDIAEGIIWAAGGSVAGVPTNATPAKVINLSISSQVTGACSATFQNAINSARSSGASVAVAAGNLNLAASNYLPGNCLGVITVAATARNGGKAFYSNHGSPVDLAAPGGEISIAANGVLSTFNTGSSSPGADSYAYRQGTSMAAPHVAGIAALMLSLRPSLGPDDVELILRSNTRAFPASCSGCGTGILDAAASVTVAGVGSPLPPSSATITPASLNGGRSGSGTVTKTATLYILENGKAPFNYQWSITNGFSLGSPTKVSTTVSGFVQACDVETATLTITVTDALGRTGNASAAVQYSATARPGSQCP